MPPSTDVGFIPQKDNLEKQSSVLEPQKSTHLLDSLCAAPLNPVTSNGNCSGAETPYQPLAEHFSHYGGQSESSALHRNEDELKNYAPIYGTLDRMSFRYVMCVQEPRLITGN